MRAIFFLALAALATAEPSQSKVDNVNEPQDGDVHNRVKRELTGDPDGYGPNINVDLEIKAGPYAHVAVDVDVNIGLSPTSLESLKDFSSKTSCCIQRRSCKRNASRMSA
ncbi:uncharacterized protein LOC119580911 [Penaeus monodon]|uniref:uncharacterized protein LOC119580911 n=1 Tax=Penaeus monodon TaxID=6687 RepID=UPI0018A7A62A|nr:uncharacterized protein LOC119580911 [Penaeus monodon]